MPLSTTSLFHFTNRKSALIGILKHTFKVKYSFERLEITSGTYSAAYPMVSFCDIPLSQIREHIRSYGHYGIGLNKEWGKAMRLNPVLYLEANSWLTQKYFESYVHFINKISDNNPEIYKAKFGLMELLRYTKNFKGTLYRKEKKPIEKYIFSNEREWRYVPLFEEALGIINEGQYTAERKKEANRDISSLRLHFTANDIKYIIVKEESQIDDILAKITMIKGPIHSSHVVDKLKSRVITSEQIFADF